MKVLYLGPWAPIIPAIEHGNEDVVTRTEEPITTFGDADFVVSYNYRYVLKNRKELKAFDGRAVNLHISYLPWNRGAHPNVWSFVDDTPKGVTIHLMSAGLDKGDILYQEAVSFLDWPDVTLGQSYAKLHSVLMDLFALNWIDIRAGRAPRKKQPRGGSYHRRADLKSVRLPKGWKTPAWSLSSAL